MAVDSSGWLEYLTGLEKADLFAPHFESDLRILVPVIVLYEVRKILLLRPSRSLAAVFVSEALRRKVIAIDQTIAVAAAAISSDHQLAMAEALLYAAAQSRRAQFITSDTHFKGLPGVTLI